MINLQALGQTINMVPNYNFDKVQRVISAVNKYDESLVAYIKWAKYIRFFDIKNQNIRNMEFMVRYAQQVNPRALTRLLHEKKEEWRISLPYMLEDFTKPERAEQIVSFVSSLDAIIPGFSEILTPSSIGA
ncbi:hypothetical protein D3C80_1748010 [compost metagenome]